MLQYNKAFAAFFGTLAIGSLTMLHHHSFWLVLLLAVVVTFFVWLIPNLTK